MDGHVRIDLLVTHVPPISDLRRNSILNASRSRLVCDNSVY